MAKKFCAKNKPPSFLCNTELKILKIFTNKTCWKLNKLHFLKISLVYIHWFKSYELKTLCSGFQVQWNLTLPALFGQRQNVR